MLWETAVLFEGRYMLQMDASFCDIGLKIQLAALRNSDSDDPKTEVSS